MQKDSEGQWKKTVNLSKEECGKLSLMLTEISKGLTSVEDWEKMHGIDEIVKMRKKGYTLINGKWEKATEKQ